MPNQFYPFLAIYERRGLFLLYILSHSRLKDTTAHAHVLLELNHMANCNTIEKKETDSKKLFKKCLQ